MEVKILHLLEGAKQAKAYIPEGNFFGVAHYTPLDTPDKFMEDPELSVSIAKECYCLASYVKRGLIPDFPVK